MSWKGGTRRLDLKSKNTVVLVRYNGHWEPFKITGFDVGNKKVEGVWILTDDVVKLDGGLPTHDINNEWVDIYLEWMIEEGKKIKNRIKILKELKR